MGGMLRELHLTGNPDADKLLNDDPFALLVGMLLDQQYPMEHAFSGPLKIANRMDGFDLHKIAATDLETARGALEIRFWGAYAAVKHAAPRLRRGGSIVLSSGIASARPQATWTVASSICGAVEALTRALAVELAPIRVNAVAPGVVRSNLWRDMSEDDRSAMYASLAQALPAGRAGEVGDVAETFLYLMRNGYSTGTVVTIDGGSVLV